MLWRTDKGAGIDRARLDELRAENRRLFEELDGVQQRFRGIGMRMWRVQEDERRRLARELHDQLGQVLTALIHRLERVDGEGRDACMELARHALDDVRELSRLLRPPVLDDLGLAAALKWLARRTRENAGLDVVVRVSDEFDGLDPDVETLLFRIAQEALTNVVKHAQASRAELRLHRAGNRIELRVRDDGRGFDPVELAARDERGVGLAGMQDRAALFGGKLVVGAAPGRGTTVTAVLES